MKTVNVIAFLIVLLLTSCDWETHIIGKVIDKETGKEISGATINLLDGKDIVKSDKNGCFSVSHAWGGISIDPKISISCNGYKPFQLIMKSSSNEICYSIKNEYYYVNLDKPFYPDPKDSSSYSVNFSLQKWSQTITTGDTLKIYLDRDNINAEIEKIKKNMSKIWNKN